ncbi:MAG TPA: alpha/beta hydrolase [Sandaracinaceae bacterium LLY-WYZ-13_1]|nr:alpha/beta hydrolase [Sandaracinaceae bacterium LLY-WYZ-13_1]
MPRLEPAACATDALRAVDATCYTFVGEEDWSEPNGTRVRIPVAVVTPERGAGEAPVFFFPGGPGYSILDHPDYIARLRADVGARPLVLMDHRGFRHAEPSLRCPDYAAVSPYHHVIHTPAITSSLDPMVRAAAITPAVEACHERLVAQGVAVPQYNSHAVSRDVDAIRRLLGHRRIDVFGSSTGSGTALLYLRYFPDRVRAVVFGWPWYNHLRNRPPVDELYTAKQTFTDALARCVAEDPRCRALHPAWLRAIDRARRTLDETPFVTTVEHEGAEVTLRFDGAAFLDTLYLFLAEEHGRLPALLAQIRSGDYAGLRDFFRVDRYDPPAEAPRYALGYFLAHVCNDMGEHRPTREDSLAAIRREPAVLGFEPPWLCAWWGSDGDVPPEHNDPVASDVPALAIHGQLDPCCGTRWSERVAETLPNLRIVELQGVGHSPTTECRTALIRAFLADPTAPLDDGCRDEVPLGPWQLEP